MELDLVLSRFLDLPHVMVPALELEGNFFTELELERKLNLELELQLEIELVLEQDRLLMWCWR
ncbi:hypothetical protein chiPu_0032097, partial [Chiloscyllium punctatum]|nr:hypothetical protein [Chiloscyllium punctatum]